MAVNLMKPWSVFLTSLHILLQIASSHFIVKSLPGFGQLPFTLETGYIGVGDREDVQLFYYFVESERNPMNDPLLLWLIGGPGCSGLSGFLYENGPLVFNYDDYNGTFPELKLNPNSWNKVLNILYIDAPIGTGFSYSQTQEVYNTNDTQWAEHTFDFLKKWLMDHPKFRSNPLYIGGGSYSGIPIPLIVLKVHEDYQSGHSPLQNFKGFLLASPGIDSHMDKNMKIEFAHRRTLISDELYESIKTSCNGEYVKLNPSNKACMSDYEAFSESVRYVNEYQILAPSCKKALPYTNRRIMSGELKYIHQTTFKCQVDMYELSELWANDPNVQKALNVIEGTKRHFQRCNRNVSYVKNVPSVVEYHHNLTNTNLRSLIYCGDLDMRVPYLSVHSMIKSLNLKLNITWRPWFIDNEVAGDLIQKAIMEGRLKFGDREMKIDAEPFKADANYAEPTFMPINVANNIPTGWGPVPKNPPRLFEDDLAHFEFTDTKIFPAAGEKLGQFLERLNEQGSEVDMCPKCSSVYDKTAARKFALKQEKKREAIYRHRAAQYKARWTKFNEKQQQQAQANSARYQKGNSTLGNAIQGQNKNQRFGFPVQGRGNGQHLGNSVQGNNNKPNFGGSFQSWRGRNGNFAQRNKTRVPPITPPNVWVRNETPESSRSGRRRNRQKKKNTQAPLQKHRMFDERGWGKHPHQRPWRFVLNKE